MMGVEVLSHSEWWQRYNPIDTIPNTRTPTKHLQRTWSLIKRKGEKYIVSGLVHNAQAYMITQHPYTVETVVTNCSNN